MYAYTYICNHVCNVLTHAYACGIHMYICTYVPDGRSFYPVNFSVNHDLTLYSSIWAIVYARKDKTIHKHNSSMPGTVLQYQGWADNARCKSHIHKIGRLLVLEWYWHVHNTCTYVHMYELTKLTNTHVQKNLRDKKAQLLIHTKLP